MEHPAERRWRPGRLGDQGGIGLALVLAIVGVVVVIGLGVAVAFWVLRDVDHPPEQTAKLLPAQTQVYFSLNLRPRGDQLAKFRSILARFRQHRNFQPKIDDLFNDADVETGIHPEEDVLPWLGPEVAIGIVDVVGSVVASAAGGTPLVIALMGTTDTERSLSVLRKWIAYQEREEALDFETGDYRGIPVFTERDDNQHYAVTADYVLLASDRDLLEDTIERIQDGDAEGSLFESARFKEARSALPERRFFTAYVDAEAIWQDARRQFLSAVLSSEQRRQIDDRVPEWAALTGTFIDPGLNLALSVATPEEALATQPRAISLASARLLPSDTLAFLSLGFEPDLDPLRKQLKEQRIGDLGPDVEAALRFPLGLALDADATLADLLDELLRMVNDSLGIDLEQDILAWMTGEVGLALLSTNFRKATDDPLSEAVKAMGLVQFEDEKRNEVVRATADITSWLEDAFGLVGERVSYGGGEGMVFDLRETAGIAVYDPGYLILGEHLIIATTADSLRSTASISAGQNESLAEEAEFSRLVKGVSGTRNPLLYVNLRQLTDAVVAALDPEDRRRYKENVEPFTQPLRALLAASDTQKGVSRSSMVITVD